MSLNRSEQILSDYVDKNHDEKRHWMESVRNRTAGPVDLHEVARVLEGDLWHYYKERSEVVPALREIARREGMKRTSMRNLAELWIRLWGPLRPKRTGSDGPRPYA